MKTKAKNIIKIIVNILKTIFTIKKKASVGDDKVIEVLDNIDNKLTDIS